MKGKDQPIPLLPCPWCGSEEIALECTENGWLKVKCTGCRARGPAFDNDELRAVAAWNKGPYGDRFEIHALAIDNHAKKLEAQAAELTRKASAMRAKVGK